MTGHNFTELDLDITAKIKDFIFNEISTSKKAKCGGVTRTRISKSLNSCDSFLELVNKNDRHTPFTHGYWVAIVLQKLKELGALDFTGNHIYQTGATPMTKAKQVSIEVKNTLPSLPAQFSDIFLKEKYDEVEKEVKAEVFDVTTEDGRKRIKSVAADISKSNKLFDTPMRDHLRELKSLPKVLEATARQSKERFEKLREGVLEPLKQAQKYQDDLLAWLNNIPTACSAPDATSEQMRGWLTEIDKVDQSTIWKELKKKFKVAIEAATTSAKVTLERVELAEKQAAELKELQEKQAIAEKKESDRLVAEEAVKKATRLAEEKAAQEKQAVERRAVEAKQREEKAIANAAIEKDKAEQAKKDQAQAVIDNEAREEQAKIDAQKAQDKAVADATEKERLRLKEETAEHERLAKLREADANNKARVHRGALVALVSMGISEEDAKTVIRAVARGEVPNMVVTY